MLDRRELLTLGGLLGVASGGTAEGTAVATGQANERQLADIANAINSLKSLLTQQLSFAEILEVRKSQFTYLRANGQFPDFIDVGIDIWQGIHDWHIRVQQPLVLGRDANGRYTMMLGFTALVLRQDSVPTLIGIPYDQR